MTFSRTLVAVDDPNDADAAIQGLAELLTLARPARTVWVAGNCQSQPTGSGLRLASAGGVLR